MNKRIAKFLLAASVTGMLAAPAMAADNHSAGEVLDDTIITTKVKAALVQDPVTKAHQISVDTFKGTVKLSGFVDSVAARYPSGPMVWIYGAASISGAAACQPFSAVRDALHQACCAGDQ